MSSPIVVAFGGGLNSSAMVVEMVRRKERIDALLFADTGGERPETYAHVKEFSAWLEARGYPPVSVTRFKTGSGEVETLEARCLSQNMLPSLAYGYKKCSVRFKQDPQHKWLKQWEPARAAWRRGERVVKVIGYDADEMYRPENAKKKRLEGKRMADMVASGLRKKSDKDINARLVNDWAMYEYRYPLADEWDMGRAECIATMREAGLTPPPKSSCFFCPANSEFEIVELYEKHPDLLERALAIEANAEGRDGIEPKLGRWRSWRRVIEEWTRQGSLFDLSSLRRPDPDDVPCGCYDG